MKTKLPIIPALAALWLGGILPAQAQWLTQSILVKPGWSAVYLHVDASYTNLNYLIGSDANNPIVEVWLWQDPASQMQYVTSPAAPLTGSSQWASWTRNQSLVSTLATLVPNAAYLIHSSSSNNYIWNVQGKPAAPTYSWTTTGENFIGFPTVPNNPPAFDSFLAPAPALAAAAEIYQYAGGVLGANNPSQVLSLHSTPVTRGQAFWIRSGSVYNNYFGPFQVVFQSGTGVVFGDATSQYSFHLRNPTASPVTVQLRLLPSESSPRGQTPVVSTPPLLVRGALNTSTLVYGFTNLNVGSAQSWTLAAQGQAGSDVVVVLGLNRYVLGSNPGSLYAGILRFTDSSGFTEVDVPVSAQVASYSGLWVGNALVSQVSNYLKTFARDVNNSPVTDSNGAYIVTSINTNLGAASSSFPLRLILHNDGANVSLLQRVFYGQNPSSNFVVTTSESFLDPAQLGNARRISAAHLPWSAANAPWPLAGRLAPGGGLSTTVMLNYDDQSSNPFLHTYHPDHDNLDATFQHELGQGSESYQITRQINLAISPPSNDFAGLTQAGQSFSGAYGETITVGGLNGASRIFNVAGSFTINRISPIAVLTH